MEDKCAAIPEARTTFAMCPASSWIVTSSNEKYFNAGLLLEVNINYVWIHFTKNPYILKHIIVSCYKTPSQSCPHLIP